MALSLSIAPEPASTTAHTNTRHRSVRDLARLLQPK